MQKEFFHVSKPKKRQYGTAGLRVYDAETGDTVPPHPYTHISTWSAKLESFLVAGHERHEDDIATSDDDNHPYNECWMRRMQYKKTGMRPGQHIFKRFIDDSLPELVLFNTQFNCDNVQTYARTRDGKDVLSEILDSQKLLTSLKEVTSAYRKAILKCSVDKAPVGARLTSRSFHRPRRRFRD